MGRIEKLQALLARENEKSQIGNKTVLTDGLGTPKLRNLKLSATDNTSGTFQMAAATSKQAKKAGSVTGSSSLKESNVGLGSATLPTRTQLASRDRQGSRGSAQAPASKRGSPRAALSRGREAHSPPRALEPPPPMNKQRPKGEWTLLRQFEQELTTADQVTRKKLQEKEVMEHRTFLDRQRAEKDAMLEAARVQAQKEAQKQINDLRKWNLEETAKRNQRKKLEEQIKKEQDEQLLQIRADRSMEVERIRRQEEEAVSLAKRQLDLDKEVERKRKAEREDRMKEDLKMMEQMIREKEQQKQEAKENDRKMMLDYQKLLEQQEKAREQAMSNMYAKALERSALAGAGVVEGNELRKQKEEAVLRAQQQAADQAALNAELQREARRKKLNQEQVATLQRQMRDKQEALARQRLEKIAEQEMLRQRDDIDNQMEVEASLARRERNVAHKLDLVQQMHVDRLKEQPDEVMTHQELLLNAPLISRAREVLSIN